LNRAVFLDRDGVINELVYHQEQEVIDSPFTPGQFKLIPGVTGALKALRNAGYLAILISNQPGIAKGHMTVKNFELIRQKMNAELIAEGAELNGEYYCLHHPDSVIEKYRVQCDCRKPLPGLLFKAAREKDIYLKESWLIGDNLSDIKAGKAAGCRTILIGTMKCELCRLMTEKNIFPYKIDGNVGDAIQKHVLVKENASIHFPCQAKT
jgi:D-glycero-D-manno-heptose 1,7-bisphosphate phosphatase